MGVEAVVSHGDAIHLLGTGRFCQAHHLHRAIFAGSQGAEIQFKHFAANMLQAFGQKGLDLDVIGRPVAGVADRDGHRRHVAKDNMFRRGRLHRQLRLAHLDLDRGRSGEGHSGLAAHRSLDFRENLEVDPLVLVGRQRAEVPGQDFAIFVGDRLGPGDPHALGHAVTHDDIVQRRIANIFGDNQESRGLVEPDRGRANPFEANGRLAAAGLAFRAASAVAAVLRDFLARRRHFDLHDSRRPCLLSCPKNVGRHDNPRTGSHRRWHQQRCRLVALLAVGRKA